MIHPSQEANKIHLRQKKKVGLASQSKHTKTKILKFILFYFSSIGTNQNLVNPGVGEPYSPAISFATFSLSCHRTCIFIFFNELNYIYLKTFLYLFLKRFFYNIYRLKHFYRFIFYKTFYIYLYFFFSNTKTLSICDWSNEIELNFLKYDI